MSEINLGDEETRHFAWLPVECDEGWTWLRFYWTENAVEPDEPRFAWRALAVVSFVALAFWWFVVVTQ